MTSRRIFAALVTLHAFIAWPSHAQKTKAALTTEINTNWPDNTVGEITPALLRTTVQDIVNSIMPTAPVGAGNLACFNGTTGLLQDCGSSPTSIFGSNNTWSGDQYFKSGRPWADVIAYGADPTNTSDSSTAFQSAINALASTGGVVYVPPGQYKINNTSALTITVSGIVIKGSGRYGSILHPQSTTQNLFNVTANNGVEFADMAIQGPTSAISTGGVAINFNGTQGCRAENLWITEVFGAISLNNSTACKVQFTKIYDIYGTSGIVTSNGGGDYIAFNQIDPLFYSTTVYGATSGFGAWTTSHSYSAGAVVSNASGWFVAQVGGTSASSGSGPQITTFGTLITDGTVQWYFLGATNASGIKISSTSNSNYVAFNDISGPWSQAIQIGASDNTIIVGNTIGQTLGVGLQLLASATNSYLAENFFSGTYTALGNSVLDNNGSANGTHIINNRFNGAGWHCIILNGSSDWVLTNNQITGCGLVTGASGIDVISPSLDFNIASNIIIPSSGMSNAITVTAGSSDYYNINGNDIGSGGTISDSGTGTHKCVGPNNAIAAIGCGYGTGVATALGVNIGSAGAPVLFNGALGTPSSGMLTNATGLPISGGVSGLGTGVATAAADAVNTTGGFPTVPIPSTDLANTWTSYSPTIGCGSGTITTLGSVTGNYYDLGAVRHVEIVIPITTNGTCASSITATLPSTPTSLNYVMTGKEVLSTGSILSGASLNTNVMNIVTPANTYPGGTGTKIVIDGWYRTN